MKTDIHSHKSHPIIRENYVGSISEFIQDQISSHHLCHQHILPKLGGEKGILTILSASALAPNLNSVTFMIL